MAKIIVRPAAEAKILANFRTKFARAHALNSPYRGGRADRVQARVPAQARRHRVEAQGFALSFQPVATLDRKQESERAGSEAGS
jgi:hypothetical protein